MWFLLGMVAGGALVHFAPWLRNKALDLIGK